MRIALTDFSSYKAVVVARFIKQNYPEIEIVSLDTRAYTRRVHSKYSNRHLVLDSSASTPKAYVAELAGIVRRNNIDLLIPINSQELDILLAGREDFGADFSSCLAYWGDLSHYNLLHDKAKFQELVAGIGLKIPQGYLDLAQADLPVVYKPTTASSSKGVVYIRTEAEREIMLEKDSTQPRTSRVIQQFIRGQGVGYSGFFEGGKIIVGHGHLRLAEFPVSGGSSVYRGALDEDQLAKVKRAVEVLLQHVPWSGFAMFEFKLTAGGDLYFIECNPRIWGSIYQGLANGSNYFSALLGEVKAKTVVQTMPGINTYLSPLFWVSVLKYAMRGNLEPVRLFIRNWRKNRVDVGLLQDPLGWLALVGRSFK